MMNMIHLLGFMENIVKLTAIQIRLTFAKMALFVWMVLNNYKIYYFLLILFQYNFIINKGGSCYLDNNNQEICSCKNGFYGNRCEFSFNNQTTNICTIKTCSNGNF